MKVTFCAYDRAGYFCGPNAWLRRLLPELKKQGIDVRVLCITHSDPDECPTVAALKEQGIQVSAARKHDYTEKRVRWVLESLRDNPPDVFVPHLVTPALYAARWVREAGIPTVGVVHSDDAFYRGLTREFVLGDPDFRLSSLVTVSRLLTERLLSRIPPGMIVRRIPCGVPLPSTTARYSAGPLRIIYSGRLTEEAKRISSLTRALLRVIDSVPGTEGYLYGDGDGRGAVISILDEEGRGLPVHCAGKVDSDAITGQLLNGHLFLLLSDYEGLPISLMEAMACGLVPLCLAIEGGVSELVDDGENGYLLPDRDQALVDAVARLRRDRALWERLSVGARRTIEGEYHHDRCVDRWCGLFDELAEKVVERREIVVPRRLRLPPVNPGLAREDQRSPGGFSMAGKKLRGVIRRIRVTLPAT